MLTFSGVSRDMGRCFCHRQKSGEFELAHHHGDHGGNTRAVRFNHVMGGFLVKRVALGKQFSQFGLGVSDLQQRALAVVTQAAKNFLGADTQVAHRGALVQQSPVGRTQHRAAAGGQHAGRVGAQLRNHFRLNIAKPRFAFALKKLADRATQARLNSLVRVDKRLLQAPGQMPADGRFSRAWEADEDDQNERRSDKPLDSTLKSAGGGDATGRFYGHTDANTSAVCL